MNPRQFLARTSLPVVCTAAIAALAVAGGTAYAANKLISGSQILNGSITGADIKQNSLTGADIKSGSVGMTDLSGPAKTALDGKNGKDGKDGAQGPKGDTGAKGPKGDTGAKGDKGDKGDPGAAAPAAEYGVAGVWVKRGTTAVSRWATYSVAMGAPAAIGDSTGGTFRFTCKAGQGSCVVSYSAAIVSDSSVATGHVWPRLLIERAGDQNAGTADTRFCEYADGGVGGDAPVEVARVATTVDPFATLVPMLTNVGSNDCGAVSGSGDVTEITVPEGYYNVHASFQFYAG